ncbi:MAG TPA: hypothetical protein V6C82_00215, partial [Chroococcales cyanobacterium]
MRKFSIGLILPLFLLSACKVDLGSLARPNNSISAPVNLGLQQAATLPLPAVPKETPDPKRPSESFMVFSPKTCFNYQVNFLGVPMGGLELKVVS